MDISANSFDLHTQHNPRYLSYARTSTQNKTKHVAQWASTGMPMQDFGKPCLILLGQDTREVTKPKKQEKESWTIASQCCFSRVTPNHQIPGFAQGSSWTWNLLSPDQRSMAMLTHVHTQTCIHLSCPVESCLRKVMLFPKRTAS